MTADEAAEIRRGITEVVTNAYRLGVAQGSGSELFVAGEVYSSTQLAEAQIEKDKRLDSTIEKATRSDAA